MINPYMWINNATDRKEIKERIDGRKEWEKVVREKNVDIMNEAYVM